MGFLTGFFGGFTLTASILHITLQFHLSKRHYHHMLLREQIDIINTLAIPATTRQGALKNESDIELMAQRGYSLRERRKSMADLGKEKWNKEVEELAAKVQDIKWEDIRQNMAKAWRALKRPTEDE